MKKQAALLLSIAFIAVVAMAFGLRKTTPVYLHVPKGWPKMQYDLSKNPVTEEGFELGRKLFYDPILSRDSTISCSSCHLQATGFAHVDHALSHGIEGRIGTRNAPSLVNLGWSQNFMWDGGVNHLDLQPLAPITSTSEMDETLANIVVKLQRSERYRQMFEKAFGESKITGQRILLALSQFEVSLISANSRYDKMMRRELEFTERENKGYALFKTNCAACHSEPLFSGTRFEYNGLSADSTLNDPGRFKITQRDADSLRFKVPTLRNIQFTFPYMHDGRFRTLTEVIRHYNTLPKNKRLPKELSKPMLMTDNDRADLALFLKTLTDSDFLFNPRYSYPRQ